MNADAIKHASTPAPLLTIDGLSVAFNGHAPTVQDIAFTIGRGECVGLVGESGSGKTVTARTLLGLNGKEATVSARTLHFEGKSLLGLKERDWRRLRGGRIGFVLQDALGSLDPLRTVGREIGEALRLHTQLSAPERNQRVLELLDRVKVPDPALRARQRPAQLSGGLRQRALIASAIACNPSLVIADEPTTALDAVVKKQILDLLLSLKADGTALLIISHDLDEVAQLADRIAVMHRGQIVEYGEASKILNEPTHPYTQRLVGVAQELHVGHHLTAPTREGADAVIKVRNIGKRFQSPDGQWRSALSDVSFTVRRGETLGLVGASGSGKTTAARITLGLERPDEGRVAILGDDWFGLGNKQRRQKRRAMQVVFQDPLGSFDPRHTVSRILDEALLVRGLKDRTARSARTETLLGHVHLSTTLLDRRPLTLSGGQRQRLAIARALALEPEILVCDEPVSALDLSVQADILSLLDDLKSTLGLSCLFISHDLRVVRWVSDRLIVMHNGRIVEEGPTDLLFKTPQHPYTKALLDAASVHT